MLALTFAFAVDALARIGISDWSAETPGGNEINNFIETTVYLDRDELEGLEKWYFYRGAIIGELRRDHGYFVINESNSHVIEFGNYDDWEKYLKDNRLQPVVWTRWYSSNWKTFNSPFTFWLFLAIPLTGLLIRIGWKPVVTKHLNRRDPVAAAMVAVSALIVAMRVFDSYPNSF